MITTVNHKDYLPIAFDLSKAIPIFYDGKATEKNTIVAGDAGFIPLFFGDACIYVCGARGAGKSTYVSAYINSYHKATTNKVFFVSRLETDPSIKLPDRSMRLKPSELPDIGLEDLKDSLVVFDDIHDSSLSAGEMRYMQSFIIDIIENSRHFNTSVVITSHMITNYSKTRAILNECSALVIFPKYSNAQQINYALKHYVGLDKNQIKKVMEENDSRWVQVQTHYPKFILTQHEVRGY